MLGLLAFSKSARADVPVRLTVLTWNVWGVPAITAHLDERLAAVPDAAAALEPDVIFFQELWEAKRAEDVAKRLSARGFAYFTRFESTAGSTGLAVASKLPLRDPAFRPFAIGRIPHTVWHLDWLVAKGLASAVVETPLGPLLLEDTHLQAQYRYDRYEAERLAQAAEILLMDREHSDRPLVLAGDFNSSGTELPRRVLRDLGGFEDATPSAREDSVYARSGAGLAIRVLSARTALGGPVPLGNGAALPLSDHAALLVELELSSCARCSPPRRVASATRSAAVSSLERAVAITPFRVALSLLTALTLLVLAVGWKRRMKRIADGRRGRLLLRAAGFVALCAAIVWSSYLGAVYYPHRAAALRDAASALAVLPVR